ncbi:MAG: hypothetical protein A3E18_00985 [Candidatus Nealsonbacteria bacterium RIFCSPHIGHO2_12_FULL_38_18]|nr:MAG: hypothetical protein A3E18_00985 [Candidatus Nealsonbacteria bacterium RIFCSPHIGHO2_12_FULL_38_18]
MENVNDVVIIGAGPAGLKCAEQFKGSGFSVLLIEKSEVIGPKTCAGGLTSLNYSFDFPESKTRSFGKLSVFLHGKKREINLIYPIKTINRYDLGQYLLDKIKNCPNIKILTGASVSEVKKDKIITNKGEFLYKYLVGADGSLSIVRKYLGLKSEFMMGLCYKIFGKNLSDLEIYLIPRKLKLGYIWVFPHKNYINIGIYFDPKVISSGLAKGILDDFLKKRNFVEPFRELEAAPINYLYQGSVFGNIFLIGDAAGLSSRTTGEGISYAMISGQEIGKKIIDKEYPMPELKNILKLKKRQEKIWGTFGKFYVPDFLRKLFFNVSINLMGRIWYQKRFGI